jgi:hypothetical protein
MLCPSARSVWRAREWCVNYDVLQRVYGARVGRGEVGGADDECARASAERAFDAGRGFGARDGEFPTRHRAYDEYNHDVVVTRFWCAGDFGDERAETAHGAGDDGRARAGGVFEQSAE